jgi:hypothetical protein
MKMKHAKTYEKAIYKNRVLGLQTLVIFSDGTRTVSEDFLKDGRNKATKLVGGKR